MTALPAAAQAGHQLEGRRLRTVGVAVTLLALLGAAAAASAGAPYGFLGTAIVLGWTQLVNI